MPSTTAIELRKRADGAFDNITRQLRGMEPHLERADAPGEWTTRQVLCHLLFEPGQDPVATLMSFREQNLPVIEVNPGQTVVDDARKRMSLEQLINGLDEQRHRVFGFVDGLSDAELRGRKARIPLFKQIMGVEEIPIARFIGGMYDYHWNDHAGQLAKIRKSAGLSPA